MKSIAAPLTVIAVIGIALYFFKSPPPLSESEPIDPDQPAPSQALAATGPETGSAPPEKASPEEGGSILFEGTQASDAQVIPTNVHQKRFTDAKTPTEASQQTRSSTPSWIE